MTIDDTPSPAADDPRLARFALNQKTIDQWSMEMLVEACVDAGVPSVGLWREPVAEYGLERTVELFDRHELRVSSLCRGGFVTSADGPTYREAIEENRRAIDEAVALRATCLVLVVGGLPAGSRDLVAARSRVRDAVAELAEYASERGVRLALEALHPMFCADRAVLSTLGQALDLAEDHASETVGVVVDAYHVWWDPDLASQIERAAGRIASFQVSDWVMPLADDPLLSRGVMGDGHIDLTGMLEMVTAAGYAGDIEVEIFNAELWAADGREVLDTLLRRYVADVLPST